MNIDREIIEARIKAKEIIEQRHFEYLHKIKAGIIRDNYKYTPTTSVYDLGFRSGNSLCIAEIKVRNDWDDTQFIKYGAFLQEDKYKSLCRTHSQILASANTNVTIMYLNFTRDSIQVYRLPLNKDYKFFDWLLPINNVTPEIKIMKSVTRLYNPEETILLKDVPITEDEYLYINSSED